MKLLRCEVVRLGPYPLSVLFILTGSAEILQARESIQLHESSKEIQPSIPRPHQALNYVSL